MAQRQALHAVLESSIFKKSLRLARLLQYICEKYFSGDTRDVKEYSIAVDIFRRPTSFDPATDSIVRVEIYRLRKKLREFYDGEGMGQELEIVIATGQYLPQFIPRPTSPSMPELPSMLELPSTLEPPSIEEMKAEGIDAGYSLHNSLRDAAHLAALAKESRVVAAEDRRTGIRVRIQDSRFPASRRNLALTVCALLALAGLLGAVRKAWDRGYGHRGSGVSSSTTEVNSTSGGNAGAGTIGVAEKPLRIRCGYTKPLFRDESGNLWIGDQYFQGGAATEVGSQHIAATRNAQLYLTYRSGTFSYKIPLQPGTYEMRLHFAETTYGPAAPLGGGENSRVFDVQMNGKPLLTQFDVEADAGENTADVRVFQDIHPAPDGFLHLDFIGVLGLPMINAIEILPGIPHRLHTIRMVAQNNFFVDKAGNLWSPDSYFIGGQLGEDQTVINGTDDPGLYAGERYGNFRYALPADAGTYTLTLFFSEKYWGEITAKNEAVGQRVFDVRCNGIALIRNLDIVSEVGPGHALTKTFSGLHPNAQGKIVVSFVPVVNYALVDAVELKKEGS